jgi:gamma-butyrobetaine dioxygenase
MSPVDHIEELFRSEGAQDYLGEPVTVSTHLLQAAALAEAAGAPAPLVAAALLHDVGHLPLRFHTDGSGRARSGQEGSAAEPGGQMPGGQMPGGHDNRHGDRGAAWLSAWFPANVTEPVRLHVAAKRYLCVVELSYVARLSQASRDSLSAQGGPMNDAEAREFEALPYAGAAVEVRRWDDQAKDPLANPPGFEHFRPLLESLL